MQPTDLLSQDHRIIESVMNALEAAVRRLQAGAPVRPGFFVEAAEFIKGFADGCHHRKEEDHLFPAMEEAGFPRFGGPIGVMLGEHDEGRQYTGALSGAAERLASGDASAADAVAENALRYIGLLRQHIMKEDNVLFVMAKRTLAPEQQDALLQAFERVEREDGTRERWLALAGKLEREAGTAAAAPAHS